MSCSSICIGHNKVHLLSTYTKCSLSGKHSNYFLDLEGSICWEIQKRWSEFDFTNAEVSALREKDRPRSLVRPSTHSTRRRHKRTSMRFPRACNCDRRLHSIDFTTATATPPRENSPAKLGCRPLYPFTASRSVRARVWWPLQTLSFVLSSTNFFTRPSGRRAMGWDSVSFQHSRDWISTRGRKPPNCSSYRRTQPRRGYWRWSRDRLSEDRRMRLAIAAS